MKTNLMRAALACAALAMTSAAVMAGPDPIPGVDLVLHGHGLAVQPNSGNGKGGTWTSPWGDSLSTDANGRVTFEKLPPGNYVLFIKGASLVAAVDRLIPPKKKDRGSLSVGIGGSLFGGGSSHSSQKDSGHEGLDNGHPDSGHDTSQSGVGVGVDVPFGGNDKAGHGNSDIIVSGVINIILRRDSPAGGDTKANAFGNWGWTGAGSIGMDVPYCPDSASQGARVEFAVPEGGGTVTLQMSIADQASAGNLTSY